MESGSILDISAEQNLNRKWKITKGEKTQEGRRNGSLQILYENCPYGNNIVIREKPVVRRQSHGPM